MGKLKLHTAIFIATASFLLYCCNQSKPVEHGNDAKDGSSVLNVDPKKIDTFIAGEMERQGIPGASVAVVYAGKIIYKNCFGLANVEYSIPVKRESPFKIASLTKPFTAIAIMQLMERGKISLDEKITTYLDGLPAEWSSITIGQLLHHTSGLADYFKAPDWSWKNSWRIDLNHDEFIQMCSRSPMVYPPGTKMKYCNTGYYLLGMVIEKASGLSYEEYLSEHIFRPIRMSHSQLDKGQSIIYNRVSGYTLYDKALKNAEFTSDTWAYSEGGIITTAEDLAKLDSSFYTNALLKKASLEQLWLPSKLTDGSDGIIGDNGAGKSNHYGAGWFISDYKGHRLILAGGNKPGYTCTFFRFPDNQVSVIILSNLSSSDLYPVAGKIAEMYLEHTRADTTGPARP
ncbi:MAG TPA: serine hydrolase domain-containing protein [Chryseolinea sp.]|nr:serine hydrolase domain-containing protein [Chryseolinea sp.]